MRDDLPLAPLGQMPKVLKMQMFSNKEDALVWLVVQGWRQDDDGRWLKGNREAVLNPSPLNDGVVCVVTRKV
jgi:hypothetical protein